MKKNKEEKKVPTIVFLCSILLAILYFIVRSYIYLFSAKFWYESVIGILLLISEGFIILHVIGYLVDLINVFKNKLTSKILKEKPRKQTFPAVVILIPSYKEPIDILKNTIVNCYNLTYKNKKIILLDDTRYELKDQDIKKMQQYKKELEELCKRFKVSIFRRKWRGAKAGIINDFIDYSEKKPLKGSILTDYSEINNNFDFKYITVFDADQNPFPNFLENLIIQIENNPKLAFIQTPQYYTNFENSRIAKSSGMQQIVFYEYICEGKSINNSMFCCGTNVVFRKKALIDVGKFDESSVTEDFATSIKFHMKNWQTKYEPSTKVFGLGPEDLGSYYNQQFRWALGTLSELKKNIFRFFKNPFSLSITSWWEYFLSSSYYLIGFVYLILIICPVLYLIFEIPSYFGKLKIYGIVFLPYFFITLFMFFSTLKKRGYKARNIILAQFLIYVSFPVYIKALFYTLFGIKSNFKVTTKKGTTTLSIWKLWPQLLLASICFISLIWGINRIIHEPIPIIGILINMIWCTYNFVILSSILYFNTEDSHEKDFLINNNPNN